MYHSSLHYLMSRGCFHLVEDARQDFHQIQLTDPLNSGSSFEFVELLLGPCIEKKQKL